MNFESIAKDLPALFCALLVAILFLQSGLDKAFDWSGNLGFLKDHFSKTFLAGTVPMMLGTITVLEIVTGVLAAAGLVYYFAAGSLIVIFYGAALGTLVVTALFFGQRIAKDYAGAAVLIPYFLLLIVLMSLSSAQFSR